MKEVLISDIKGIFENMGIKVIEGYDNLKANEITYNFMEKNRLQLNYEGCNYDMVDEAIRGLEFLNNKIKNFKCTFEKNSVVWIKF